MTTTHLVTPGEGSVSNANTTVRTNVNYTADSMDKVIFLESGATLTLAPNPSQGKTILVVAVGAVAAVLGGAFPIAGGNLSLPKDSSVLLAFDTENVWVPSTQSEGTSTAGQNPLWFIDEQNITGNASDLNNGTTPATPLLTHTELEKRLEGELILPPAVLTPIPVPFPPFFILVPLRPWTVILLSNCTTANPAGLQVTFGPDVLPQYLGFATTPSSSGTFTAVTEKKRATNTPYSVTDTARGGTPWEQYKRIRITASVNPTSVGAISFVAENTVPNECVTLDWAVPDPYPFQGVTEIIPAVGDAYVVENLTELTLKSDWNQNFVGNSLFVPIAIVGFKNIKVTNSSAGLALLRDVAMMFGSCQINPHLLAFQSAIYFKSSALLNSGTFSGGVTYIISGGAFEAGGGGAASAVVPSFEVFSSGGGFMFVDADAGCYGGPSWHLDSGANLLAGFLSTFKATIKPGHVGGSGHGVNNPAACNFILGIHNLYGGSRLWGSGNAGKGVYGQPGSTMAWRDPAHAGTQLVPTIEGAGGPGANDFALGLLTNTTSTRIDPAAATPAWLSKIPNTWATLNSPIAAPGFAGTAIDAASGARITEATTDFS